MTTHKLVYSWLKLFLDWIFSGDQHCTHLNHYVDFVVGGFEIGFIPAEALSECPVLSSEETQ